MNYYVQALQSMLFNPAILLSMCLCNFVGIIFGAIPGLSAGLIVTVLLPLTFGMSSQMGLALLINAWIGALSGGFISATLIGIPGTPSSVATCFDAYPMSKKGQSTKALAAGIVASFIGTLGSIILATFLSPVIASLAVKLGPWEYFSLCTCSLVMVSSLAKGSLFRGIGAALIGILLSCVGMAPSCGTYRFTFGNVYLSGGIDLVALMLGIFAIRQVLVDFGKDQQELVLPSTKSTGGLGLTLQELSSNLVNIVRSFFIGLWIGFLPGMGSGLSNMVAYSTAKNSSKKPDEFGKGCIDGIFASEVSNNAAVGGAVIPMIALGIPGDAITALLLSGLMIHGLQPGPLLFTNNPDVVYYIFAAVMLAGVITFVIQLCAIHVFPYLLKIKYHYLYSAIVIMCFTGAYISKNTIFNIFLMLLLAAVAILLDIGGIPVSPLILGFILGPLVEKNFRNACSYSSNGLWPFLTRPLSAAFLLVAVVTVVWPIIKDKMKKTE